MIQSPKSVTAIITFLAAVFISSPVFAARYTITVNSNTRQGTVPHFWSRCVGTGGAQLCLDANWKAHAKIGVAEAGFQAFRGHRILTASNPITWNGSGTPTYNWTAFDQIYDFLVDSLHSVPIMELSSMPPALQTSGEWSPPRNYDIWQDMINKGLFRILEWRYRTGLLSTLPICCRRCGRRRPPGSDRGPVDNRFLQWQVVKFSEFLQTEQSESRFCEQPLLWRRRQRTHCERGQPAG
jgi:hypothetical protein